MRSMLFIFVPPTLLHSIDSFLKVPFTLSEIGHRKTLTRPAVLPLYEWYIIGYIEVLRQPWHFLLGQTWSPS